VIDLHTHLLPGIDDGPVTLAESLELAATFVAEGVTSAICTPHVRDDYATTPDAMESALALLEQELAASEIPLEIRGGGEIAIDELLRLDPRTRARFGLGGNPRLLLLEFPYYGWPLALEPIVSDLASAGTVALIAHPERSREVQDAPLRLAPLVESGAYIQLTASSLAGRAGSAVTECARALLANGLAHVVASDSHGPAVRRAGLGSVAAALGDEALATWLTERVPAALLAGATPPPRPYRPPAAKRRLRRFG
jgi:protein-tyrosine phosphatase